MKKYFVVSDIHGFYKELKDALWQSGFRKSNKNHVLIVCGDIFDRGGETLSVYSYLNLIPKSRRILIKGNHESLYLDLLKKPFPEEYDFHNRTVNTFCDIAQVPIDLLNEDTYGFDENRYVRGSRKAWKDIVEKVENHPITKWLRSDEWRDYYEVGKYIFVHSFLPLVIKKSYLEENKDLGIYAYATEDPKNYDLDDDWRNACAQQWEDARWGSPWRQYQCGLFKSEEEKGKVLVCGHWHTSDFYKNLKLCHLYDRECAPIYYSKGLIGLDGGCMYNWYYEEYIHPQNVLVINDPNSKVCYDKNGVVLVEIPHKLDRQEQ